MPKASISEHLLVSSLLRSPDQVHALAGNRGMSILRPDDMLKGRIEKGRNAPSPRSGVLGAKLTKLMSGRRAGGRSSFERGQASGPKDMRQRVVATVFYQRHSGGGAAKLLAHGKYLERDGAGPDGEPGHFFDEERDDVDANGRLAQWAQSDKRHTRLMLAPESGARLEDIKDFTRATMAQMERDLGAGLEWVAVAHHNTDNPHVHIILRGVRRDGVELIIPREYATKGLRLAARDVATQMLGARGPEDERLALDRETRAEKHTRLDRLIEEEIKENRPVQIQAVGRAFEPTLRAALRNRVRELAKMGLAREEKRGRFRFEPDWSARLREIGKGIDLRRRLNRELAPGQGRLRLYRPSMGRVVGEVMEFGRRGEVTKGYVIVRGEKTPILANVGRRDIEALELGALLAVEAKEHSGRGVRVRVDRLSERSISSQLSARAETELDREIARTLVGRQTKLPDTPEIKAALAARLAWHEREGSGQRDLTGRFEFAPGALEGLRSEEWRNEASALARGSGKRFIDINDGLDRDWTVRAIKSLHSGRVAILERNDGVALAPISRGQILGIGRTYALSMTNGKAKITPSRGLER